MTLGKLLNHSEPQFLHLWNEGIGLDAFEVASSSNTLGVMLWQGSPWVPPKLNDEMLALQATVFSNGSRIISAGRGQLANGRDNKTLLQFCPTL